MLTLVDSKCKVGATVDNETILEAPKLELKKGMRVLSRLELLVGEVYMGAGLEMLDLTTMLELEDKIANARLHVEPAVGRRGRVLHHTGKMGGLVLLQQLDISLDGSVIPLGLEPGEVDLLEGPCRLDIVTEEDNSISQSVPSEE